MGDEPAVPENGSVSKENGNGNGNGKGNASRKWIITLMIFAAATVAGVGAFFTATWLLVKGIISPDIWKAMCELIGIFLFLTWGGVGAGYGVLNVSEKGITGYVDVVRTRAGGVK